MAEKKKSRPYVNNKEFLEKMIEYKNEVRKAEDQGDERPRVPMYIGNCIMKIATHLSHKPNFINYTFREEMISDGIENCLQYIDNFNPEKSGNPFAYFTQIIYFAFIRRIQKEKKHLYTKYKLSENANVFDMTSEKQAGDSKSYDDGIKYGEWSQEYMNDFINSFEENKRKKRVRKAVDEVIK
tara:strand:- start:321 stop:869 length:549 start_codon:yes stop_codon:yes gene_type:complete